MSHTDRAKSCKPGCNACEKGPKWRRVRSKVRRAVGKVEQHTELIEHEEDERQRYIGCGVCGAIDDPACVRGC